MFLTCFDDRMAYVTFPDENIIRVVSCVNQLEVVNEITVKIRCSGITKIDQDKFALACRSKCKIYIMSRNGTKLRTIKPLIGIDEMSTNHVPSTGMDDVNDSDEEAGTIRLLTLDGEAISEVRLHGDPITFPRSIAFDKTGHYMAVTHKGDGDDCFSVFQLLSS
ncbi:unnamed protein product [Mytilus edulis]|uniref:Uncharacterized protein n=1 Tax=Mytilus edulis TaxID=6550 RepID=A0A8S3U6H5_MYTED|nr:unnamed protein product [Mytilus edulis]